MQITHFTTRKQIGFKLPPEAFRALSLIEDRRSPLFQDIITLRQNLSRVDNVVRSEIGLNESDTVYVDFDTDHNEDVPTVDQAADIIAIHARAAHAVQRLLPGSLQHGYVSFPKYGVDGGLIDAFGRVPSGRIVHLDEHYLVIANADPGEASIHYIRNGNPAWTQVSDHEAIAHLFWDSLTDTTLQLDGTPVLPTRDLDHVTEWVMSQAYVPALEHDGTFDISGHHLGEWGSHARVLYADTDVVVTGSKLSMTAHFKDEGRYGCVLFQGDRAKQLSGALQTTGLAPIDPGNPVRLMVDEAIISRRRYLATRDLPPAMRSPAP